jgi:hypothetical protein
MIAWGLLTSSLTPTCSLDKPRVAEFERKEFTHKEKKIGG